MLQDDYTSICKVLRRCHLTGFMEECFWKRNLSHSVFSMASFQKYASPSLQIDIFPDDHDTSLVHSWMHEMS